MLPFQLAVYVEAAVLLHSVRLVGNPETGDISGLAPK
jgi:hypothetical protein